jgi:hypothetical protein
MKKILMAATAALCFAGGSFAQENQGGDSASKSAFGDMKTADIAGTVVALGVIGGLASNTSGGSTPAVEPGPTPEPGPTCSGSDPLVDGVCTGTTTTVTVSGTGTVTVPVTFTYTPTA